MVYLYTFLAGNGFLAITRRSSFATPDAVAACVSSVVDRADGFVICTTSSLTKGSVFGFDGYQYAKHPSLSVIISRLYGGKNNLVFLHAKDEAYEDDDCRPEDQADLSRPLLRVIVLR